MFCLVQTRDKFLFSWSQCREFEQRKVSGVFFLWNEGGLDNELEAVFCTVPGVAIAHLSFVIRIGIQGIFLQRLESLDISGNTGYGK